MRTRRLLTFWLVLVVVTVGAIAITGEILVRLTSDGFTPKRHYRPGIYAEDAERGWSVLPGYRGVWVDHEYTASTSINRGGYRGPEESPERLGAGLRVLVLGDSVAFGRGVADGESYPARLEAMLRKRGFDAAVFNLAVPGYDSYFERRTLELNVDHIDPHLVLVGWYRNDIIDNSVALDFSSLQVIDGYLIYDADRYRAFRRRIASTGLQRSELLNFVRVYWKFWRKRLGRERRLRRREVLETVTFAETLAQLNAIQERCLERGVPFVLVVHPERVELESGASLYASLGAGVSTERYRGATTVVNIADAWRDEIPETLYQPGDRAHPSAYGHDSIARILAALPVWETASSGRPRAALAGHSRSSRSRSSHSE